MNKFFFACLAALAVFTANGQFQKNLTAILTATTPIVPNTTMDIEFILKLTNSDMEFGDSLAIEFEEGVTPNSTPNNPFAATTKGQDAEVLNGVFGQLVSWGDNQNGAFMGGIETNTFYKFVVNVTIDDTVTTAKYVRLHVSGDKNPFNPNLVPKDYNGGTYLNLPDPGPNLSLTFNKPVPDYYYIQKNQLADTLPVFATVINYGTTINDQAVVIFDATPGPYYVANQLPRPFNEGDTVVSTSPVIFKPRVGKTYNFKVKAQTTTDTDLSNNSDSCFFSVTDTVMSRANDVATDSITLVGNGVIGSVYNFIKQDTISSLAIYLINPQPGDSLSLSLYSMSVLPDSLVASTRVLRFDSTSSLASGWYTVPFEDTIVMPATTFFVGVNQLTADRLNMGVTSFKYQTNTNYVLQDGSTMFDPAEPIGPLYANNYMIRIHTGSPWDLDTTGSTVGIAKVEQLLKESVYPNPVSESLKFSELLNGMDYFVTDIKGSRVMFGKLENGTLDVKQLAVGTYVLNVGAASFKFVRD